MPSLQTISVLADKRERTRGPSSGVSRTWAAMAQCVQEPRSQHLSSPQKTTRKAKHVTCNGSEWFEYLGP